jgi:hypothetical protein
MDFIGKIILITSFTKFIETLIKKLTEKQIEKKDQKKKICELIIAIKTANESTRNFIYSDGYIPNTDLTNLWRDCLRKAVAANINEGLEDYLYHKADFWGNPQEWLGNPSAMELVPKLQDLDKKCDILLQMLKNN